MDTKNHNCYNCQLDSFGLSQVYAIIVLPNGGPDLEAFTFKNAAGSGWHQACSIFWQIATALDQAEDLMAFEVRFFPINDVVADVKNSIVTYTGARSW